MVTHSPTSQDQYIETNILYIFYKIDLIIIMYKMYNKHVG